MPVGMLDPRRCSKLPKFVRRVGSQAWAKIVAAITAKVVAVISIACAVTLLTRRAVRLATYGVFNNGKCFRSLNLAGLGWGRVEWRDGHDVYRNPDLDLYLRRYGANPN